MGSKVKNLLKAAAPLALNYFAPGLGTALGSALGAGASFAPAVGGALIGGATGALTGGGKLSNVLKGAATGGIGGYAGSGGFGDIGGGINDVLGLNGTIVGDLIGGNQNAGFSPGEITSGAIGSTPPIIGAAGGGAASSFGGGNLLSNVLSAGLGSSANADAEEELLRAQQQAAGAIAPFANTEFKPEDLQNDPGYQFRLQQGEQALARQQAARGNYFSGEAGKAAQEYGQGLAAQEFADANQRYNQNRGFNYGVATDQAGIFGNQGNIKAQSGINQSNLLSGALSGILGGQGINNQGQSLGGRILGYDPQTGQPIYG